jgi:hypothetical protein
VAPQSHKAQLATSSVALATLPNREPLIAPLAQLKALLQPAKSPVWLARLKLAAKRVVLRAPVRLALRPNTLAQVQALAIF